MIYSKTSAQFIFSCELGKKTSLLVLHGYLEDGGSSAVTHSTLGYCTCLISLVLERVVGSYWSEPLPLVTCVPYCYGVTVNACVLRISLLGHVKTLRCSLRHARPAPWYASRPHSLQGIGVEAIPTKVSRGSSIFSGGEVFHIVSLPSVSTSHHTVRQEYRAV